MSLILTLLVRDEEDILDANLRYHLDHQNVDHVIVTNNCSVDFTREILSQWESGGSVTVIDEPDDTYQQSMWVTRMACLARDLGASWIINSDADEFWILKSGERLGQWFRDLRYCNIVAANRHDFICLEDDRCSFWERMVWRKVHSLNAIGEALPPKVAHRARKGLVVGQGNHSVSGFLFPRVKTGDLEILHFPIRSRTQYLRKILQGGAAYERNSELSKAVGQTWRQQYAELLSSGEIAYLNENIVSYELLARRVVEGTAIFDDRLRTILLGINRCQQL